MTNDQIQKTIRASGPWINGAPLTIATVASMISRTGDRKYCRTRANQALLEMVDKGEASQIKPGTYQRRLPSRKVICQSWRTMSNEEIGIESECYA